MQFYSKKEIIFYMKKVKTKERTRAIYVVPQTATSSHPEFFSFPVDSDIGKKKMVNNTDGLLGIYGKDITDEMLEEDFQHYLHNPVFKFNFSNVR